MASLSEHPPHHHLRRALAHLDAHAAEATAHAEAAAAEREQVAGTIPPAPAGPPGGAPDGH